MLLFDCSNGHWCRKTAQKDYTTIACQNVGPMTVLFGWTVWISRPCMCSRKWSHINVGMCVMVMQPNKGWNDRGVITVVHWSSELGLAGDRTIEVSAPLYTDPLTNSNSHRRHEKQELIRRWDSERELLYDDNIHVEASAYAHWTDLLISTFYYKYLWQA